MAGVLALNLVSSPGSGKTTLLVETIKRLKGELPVAVIEGDQQTSMDAERIRATGAPAIQINTGKGCHLDAHMTGHAVEHLKPGLGSVLFIENVGNLVCPAMFDLGEEHRVVLVSVTEGEDKPLKYPDMIRSSRLMLITKVDLLPHLDFDVDALAANARKINPGIRILKVSARTGEGMDAWVGFIRAARSLALTGLRQPRTGVKEVAMCLALPAKVVSVDKRSRDGRLSRSAPSRKRSRSRSSTRSRRATTCSSMSASRFTKCRPRKPSARSP